ncbi:hypothetical protein I3843_08G125300 [Carya illinoinensis]|uniref:Uncharacterized protein n=1 Tax=Carya illinoinensis TaxID=32201 RepID=A0A922D083_CARIL|nr:hypothetical protein I3842_Q092200 [Carya illinoinensis]KAG6619620.1 hypothetical protein I3842_Q092200 [Carya illinoinensis]KAG6619621.1 hypothetical protein I3842_Q092200 [Carya illinoinensis]KAG6700813.1 hypothetical protein I3842_08G132100 [Carya illinoinensis]KAG7967932.1 hypothetical protein I3843_08G125300 [Carya illinoinensis]
MTEERSTGVVRWFNDVKGFGFITPEDGGEDLFFHQSVIKSDGSRSLAEGERVEFQIELGVDDRTKAVNVTRRDGSPLQGNKKDSYARSGRGGGGWRIGSGGDRRNGGGRAGVTGCYNCGDPRHLARDCYRGNIGGGGGGCFSCGEVGHMARDCPQGNDGGGGGGACYNCGGYGHLARDCRGGGSGGPCYSCGEFGHLTRDCRNIGVSGRFSGGSGGPGGRSGCFNCEKQGHLAKQCPDAT